MAKNKINLTAQPQAIEAEQAVLGSMLISKDAVSKSLQWLPSANYFYKEAHSKIYACMIDLFDKPLPTKVIRVDNPHRARNTRRRFVSSSKSLVYTSYIRYIRMILPSKH